MKHRISTCFIIVFFSAIFSVFCQKIATLEVTLPTGVPSEMSVSVHLDDITFLPDSALVLQEVRGSEKIIIPYQISISSERTLHWIVPSDGKQRKKVYELVRGTPKLGGGVTVKMNEGGLVLQSGSKKMLRYQVNMVYPPTGVDTAYRRNGFIHPLWSPHGQELTRIQPKDHYHHYGIWNPWTHVLYKGDTVDFWNIRGRKGTVRYAGILSTSEGALFGGFEARHEHVVTKKDSPPEVAMNEVFSVKTWQPTGDYYMVDIVSRLSCATDAPVKLLEYRYGGLGWRTTEVWDNQNSEVITSEGKGRKEADGSKAKWCIIQGALGSDYGGAIMMSHPSNYNHPEPLRIWPEDQYKRGDMFANFSPTKDKDWELQPGKSYLLRYRFVVFNGKMTKEKAEAAWKSFAQPPLVTVKLNESSR